MNVVATSFCFLAALVLTLARGTGPAFAYTYLPAISLLSTVTSFQILGLPDPTPPTAAIYGILGGAVLRGGRPSLRFESVDYLFVLLLLTYAVSAVRTEYLYAGVSTFGGLLLELVAPYFIVRSSLQRRSTQRKALLALVVCSFIIALFALIEFRLTPNFYASLVTAVGLRESYVDFAWQRFGFLRAASSFIHPIDLGNSAGLMFVSIIVLATRSGLGLRNPWVGAGALAALVACLTAMSFTSYLGLAAGLGLYLPLSTFPAARRHLVLVTLAAIALGFLYTWSLAMAPLADPPASDSALSGSFRMRHMIIREAWQTAASAGPLGLGRLARVETLESVDNAYLVIAIQRGWIALSLWLALPVCLAMLVSRALRRARSRDSIRVVLMAFCASFGTMVAMFTVFLGFAYQSLFVVVLALAVNAAQAAQRAANAKPRPTPAQAPRLARHA